MKAWSGSYKIISDRVKNKEIEMNVAINGLGRIGKNFLRAFFLEPSKDINLVAINIGPNSLDMVPYIIKYDTLLGTYNKEIRCEKDVLFIAGQKIQLFAHTDPRDCKWSELEVDWVVDCSGKFTHRQDAQKHLESGAHYVLISAPAHQEDVSIIPGINDSAFDPKKDKIVSLGSCTTNAFVPMLHVLHERFTITRGFMTTIHAYTNSQVLLDVQKKDPRRSRAAALNIIPTSTGAAKMVNKIMPDIGPLIDAVALRVPVAKCSLIDLVVTTAHEVTAQQVNDAFKDAAQNTLKGIVAVSDEPLVSTDYYGNSHSVVIDALLTITQGTMVKLFGWYDNEWGYSMRLRDFIYAQKK